MNCDRPIIAVRKAGLNRKTGRAFRPHTFFKFEGDQAFVDRFFRLKRFEREIRSFCEVISADLFRSDETHIIQSFNEQDQEILLLPCGKCNLCHRRYKRDWACRCIAEAQIAGGGTFLTLTCSDESQPRTFPGDSLDHRPFQLFMKRLRKRQDEILHFFKPDYHELRYFMCGEYGEQHHRPHYHAVLFGCTFNDPYFVGHGKSGQPLFSSPWLDQLRYDERGREIFGMVSNFCEVCPATISYTVGYVDKKIARSQEDFIRAGKKAEYVVMSRRPGIGYEWLRRFRSDVWKFYNDSLLQDGVRFFNQRYFPPRYFFERSKIDGLLSDQECDIIQKHRRNGASKVSLDPDSLLDSLKRAHAAEFKLGQRLKDVQLRRQF